MFAVDKSHRARIGLLLLALTSMCVVATAADTSKPQDRVAGLSTQDRLLSLEAMKDLRLTFCRALDSHDWEKLRATMADDFVLYFADETGSANPSPAEPVELKGADTFVEFAKKFLGAAQKSIHICTMPQIEFQSVNKAHGLWFIEGYFEGGGQSIVGYERLEDDYVRVNGKWRISKADARIQARYVVAK